VVGQLSRDFPHDPHLIILAVAYHRLCGNPGEAMTLLERGLEYRPGNPDLCTVTGNLAFANGEYDKAIAYWEKALKISPTSWELREGIAEALLSLGRYQEAVDEFETKITLSRPSGRGYYLLAQGYLHLREYDKAKEYYQKVLEINPGHPGTLYGLAKVCRRLKQPEEARQYMEAHRKWTQELAGRTHDGSAETGRRMVVGRSDSQIAALPRLLARFCVHGRGLYLTRHNVEKSRQLVQEGETLFRELLTVTPDDPTLYRELAFLYLYTDRRLTEARTLAEKAVALTESAENLFLLGAAYDKTGEPAKALSAIERAIELDPANPAYLSKYNEIKQEERRP
jgi:tetratricopeptide (TPR) repeat protein